MRDPELIAREVPSILAPIPPVVGSKLNVLDKLTVPPSIKTGTKPNPKGAAIPAETKAPTLNPSTEPLLIMSTVPPVNVIVFGELPLLSRSQTPMLLQSLLAPETAPVFVIVKVIGLSVLLRVNMPPAYPPASSQPIL